MTKAATKAPTLSANAAAVVVEKLRAFESDLMSRSRMGSFLGKQYDGKRDLYTALGYKKNPTFTDYEGNYLRHPIAKGVIKAPVDASWETFPDIEESADQDTDFEAQAKALIKELKLQAVFSRVDTLSGIGSYAVLLLGFADGQQLDAPVTAANKLIFVTPYSEGSASITEIDRNTQSPRYGLPTKYTLKVGTGDTEVGTFVHHTRIIHVAQECLLNPVKGTPQLEVIFNALYDIEKLAGGDAEAYWRLVDAGVVLNLQQGFTQSDATKEKLEEVLDDYLQRFKRYLVLNGYEATPVQQEISDPINHFSMQLDLIAAAKRIPKRILLGSEIGDLASTSDKIHWMRQIKSRREQFCEPGIIRPFFDRLIELRLIEAPKDNTYNVKWDDLLTPSDKEKAEVGKLRLDAFAAYMNSGAAGVIPPRDVLRWLGCDKEEVDRIMKESGLADINKPLDTVEDPPNKPADPNEDPNQGDDDAPA